MGIEASIVQGASWSLILEQGKASICDTRFELFEMWSSSVALLCVTGFVSTASMKL